VKNHIPQNAGSPDGSTRPFLRRCKPWLDADPDKMRVRRQTVEHPFGTIKAWMGSTHFQMKTLKKVGAEMALHVLAYNMQRRPNSGNARLKCARVGSIGPQALSEEALSLQGVDSEAIDCLAR
jgi:hypothetical protein